MGCGSSSLKGDQPGNVGGSSRPSMKKTASPFAEVNYDQESQGRRDTIFAPHESKKPASTHPAEDPSRAGSSGSAGAGASKPNAAAELRAEMVGSQDVAEGDKLKPYKSIDGDEDGLASPPATKQTNPIDAVPDPTTNSAKKEFSVDNQPANHQVSSYKAPSVFSDNASTLVPSKEQSYSNGKSDSNEDGKPRKKSLYARYTDKRLNRPPEGQKRFTDEELRKYTGKSNAEIDTWSKDPNSLAAGHQRAKDYGWTTAGGFGATSSAG